jgi:hypothetical protein
MIAPTPILRVIAPAAVRDRPRVAVLVAACAAVDAIAAWILLHGTPLPPLLDALAATVSHGTAVLLLSGLARTRPSRRWLGSTALLAVPCVGAAVAITILATRGRGLVAKGRRRSSVRRPAASAQRPVDELSTCDALDCGDEERRRGALSALSQRVDPEAIALLRRAASGRDADLALSAALVLDEIGERAERRQGRSDSVEVQHATG